MYNPYVPNSFVSKIKLKYDLSTVNMAFGEPAGCIAAPKQSRRIIFCHGGENLGVELLLCWTLAPSIFSVNIRLPVHPYPKVGHFLQARAIVACKQTAYLLIRAESRRQISWDRVEV